MRLFVWDSRTVHESDKTKCAPQYKLCHIQKLVVAAGCCLTSIPRPARRQPRILEVAYLFIYFGRLRRKRLKFIYFFRDSEVDNPLLFERSSKKIF